MENIPPEKPTRSGLKLQSRPTAVKDIPCDCLELILERLHLIDHYKGWDCLLKPLSVRSSPFHTSWFLKNLKTSCGNTPWSCMEVHVDIDDSDLDHDINSTGVVAPDCHYFRVLLLDPLLGSEQKLSFNLHLELHPIQLQVPRSASLCYWTSPWFAADKGLLVLNFHENPKPRTRNRHDMFIVLNPINFSMSVLPPIPAPLCNCKLFLCCCKAVPLKLVVDLELEGGAKTTRSSSYKAYILESKKLPNHIRSSSNVIPHKFRVITYDSMTKLWARTGMEWIGTSSCTQIFPVGAGMFYVSTGRSRLKFADSLHDYLYKFQDGFLGGKVNAPYTLKQEEAEDRYCNDDDAREIGRLFSCGCISTTVFEAEGKMFFFKQTSMVGSFGPNCISARIWELNDREMIWAELPVLHFHGFEICLKPQHYRGVGYMKGSLMFAYEGILLVVHDHQVNDFYHVAGFDIFRKTWCKVPKTILHILSLSPFPFHESNRVDLNRYVFQPNISTIA